MHDARGVLTGVVLTLLASGPLGLLVACSASDRAALEALATDADSGEMPPEAVDPESTATAAPSPTESEPSPLEGNPSPVAIEPTEPPAPPVEAPEAPPEPQPGAGLLLGGACFPLCVAPEHRDPSAPDVDPSGFADEASGRCVVPTSLVGASGRASCAHSGTPTVLLPPPLDPARQAERPEGVLSSGFFVDGGRLFDAYGNDFVMRGLNVPHIWYDPPEPLEPGSPFRYDAYDALTAIAAHGTNTVRIVWQTQGGTPHLLREIISQVVALRMVPMVELHDLTGNRSAADLMTMAEYYVSDEIRSILLDFEPYLLVNIANEWSGNLLDYEPVIARMRESGINHTLVIDGSGFGQSINSILQAGPTLLAADEQHNLLFSVHMYANYAQTAAITSALTRAADLELPLIVGEFGWRHSGRDIDYEFIMSEAERLQVGFLAWSWKGNTGGDEALDMSIDWEGEQLSDYGSVVMDAIGASSEPATIFE